MINLFLFLQKGRFEKEINLLNKGGVGSCLERERNGGGIFFGGGHSAYYIYLYRDNDLCILSFCQATSILQHITTASISVKIIVKLLQI